MRCSVRIPLVVDGKPSKTGETYCYEPLKDDGICPVHGLQVVQIKDTGAHPMRRWTDKKEGNERAN
jgi:hypothetical protein